MLPLRPENSKQKWVAPAGLEDCVGALHIAMEVHDGMPFMVSKWEPTPDEVQRLIAGAPVILGISAPQHPVVVVSVGAAPQ